MVIERPASRSRTGIGALFALEETQARPTPIQPASRWREPRQAAASSGDRQDELELAGVAPA